MSNTCHPIDTATPRRIFPLTPEMVRQLINDQSSDLQKPDDNGDSRAA